MMPHDSRAAVPVATAMRRLLPFAALVLASTSLAAQPRRGPGAPATGEPRFTYVGPNPAGRVSAIAGIPGDTMTYFAGGASGGVWKTTDGGRTFTPTFDDMPVQAIGSLAVAPSNPRIVWAGTGEAWAIRDSDMQGDGIYKSTDGGVTWKHSGLPESGRIGRVIIHPTNPDIVLACVLGRTTGPQEERGVYRTSDGGATWTRTLFVNPNTGCSGLDIDDRNPATVIAGTWEVEMKTWVMNSGGPGSGVFISSDTGKTWTRQVKGMPQSPVGKIDVAIAPSNPKRMYALIQTANQGSLWRTDDGGGEWKVVSWDRRLIGRAGFYIRVDVNPENDLEVLVANSSLLRSVDGGATFPFEGGGCGDCHDIWFDQRNPAHWAVTGDGGFGITRNHGQAYAQFVLPVGQMYHVAIDTRTPYWIYSNRQDCCTMKGPSDRPTPVPNVPSYGLPGGDQALPGMFGAIQRANMWEQSLGGCESGFTLPVLSNPDLIWATCYGATVTLYDGKVGRARHVSPWFHTLDSPPTDTKYRCHWSPPLAIDPFDHNTVYFGCQVIFKTTNQGQSWTVISPDLSTQDPSRIAFSGGIIGDNLGQFYGEVVFAIAPSEVQRGLIWAGTNDGLVWISRDGGKGWTNLTKNITGLKEWGIVRRIYPSTFDAGTAYVAFDYHLMDDRRPVIYKTSDFGKTWTRISDGLPTGHPLDYVLNVAENPNRRGMLMAGTGHGFFYSMDDGKSWTQFKQGLPAAPVSWIETSKTMHEVVVSTYGRGLYVLRNFSALEQQDRVTADAAVHFYEPRPAVRLGRSGSADLLVQLKAAPRDSLRLEVLDSTGAVVRSARVAGRAGMNRLAWDMRYDAPKQPELRTIPPDNPRIWEEARFKGKETRPIIHWGIQGPQTTGPLAAPGRYAVRLHVDGVTQERPLQVVKDAAIPSSVADLQASTRLQQAIYQDINETVEMINRLEVWRKQVEDQLKASEGKPEIVAQLKALDAKMWEVENILLSRTDIHSDDKWYVERYRVYMNLVWLAGEVGTGAGDVAGGADFKPTDAQHQVHGEIRKDLQAARVKFKALLETEIKAFNALMAGKAQVVME